MIRQSQNPRRTSLPHHISPLLFLLALALLPPHAALAAGPPSGGMPSGGTPPSAQAPSIPLELQAFASCTRTPPKPPDQRNPRTKVDSECDQAGGFDPPGSWTAKENCKLSLAYNQDRWDDVQSIITSFLDSLKDCTPAKLPGDGYYSVVFFNEGLTTPTLSRILYHRNPKPEIYGNRVGSYDLFDLKLLPNLGISVTSTYQASTAPNGTIAQLPGVFAKATGLTSVISSPPPPLTGNVLPPAPQVPSGGLNATSLQMLSELTQATPATDSLVFHLKIDDVQSRLEAVSELRSLDNGLETVKRERPEIDARIKNINTDLEKRNALPGAIPPKELLTQAEGLSEDLKRIKTEILRATSPARVIFAAHRISSPKAFRKEGPATPSVVPQVSIIDQISFSPALEDYFLASLVLRAAQADQHLEQSRGWVTKVNQRFAELYRKCRSMAQISVIADRDTYLTGDDVKLTAQASDPSGRVPPNGIDVQLYIQNIESNTPPQKCIPITTTPPWRGDCGSRLAAGAYSIEADLYEKSPSATPVAKAYSSTVVRNSTRRDTLYISDRMAALGKTLSINYALDKMTADPVIEIFNVKSSGVPFQTRKINPASGSAGMVQLDTGDLGTGDWVAVLADKPTHGTAADLAVASFTVNATASSTQTASTCPLKVPDDVPPDLAGNQEFVQDVVDLSSTYTALFTFSNFGSQPSIQPLATQYTFGKLTRWSFSLGAGGMFPVFGNKPAKIDTMSMPAVLKPDPTSPAITFVAADFHPIRYDETKFSPTKGERFRLFSGLALTPKAGVVIGAGESLIRGLTLEGGFAALLGDVVPSGTKFGANSNTKTHRGFFYAPFLALGYSFQ